MIRRLALAPLLLALLATPALAQQDLDGALVGGASLKVDSFAGIIDYPAA